MNIYFSCLLQYKIRNLTEIDCLVWVSSRPLKQHVFDHLVTPPTQMNNTTCGLIVMKLYVKSPFYRTFQTTVWLVVFASLPKQRSLHTFWFYDSHYLYLHIFTCLIFTLTKYGFQVLFTTQIHRYILYRVQNGKAVKSILRNNHSKVLLCESEQVLCLDCMIHTHTDCVWHFLRCLKIL